MVKIMTKRINLVTKILHLTWQLRENLVWLPVYPGGFHKLHQNLQFLGDEGALAFSGPCSNEDYLWQEER